LPLVTLRIIPSLKIAYRARREIVASFMWNRCRPSTTRGRDVRPNISDDRFGRIVQHGSDGSHGPQAEVALICQREMRPLSFLSQKGGARSGTGACLVSLVLLFCVPVWAQTGTASSAPAASQPEVPKDALGRTTPRGTVLGFVNAARKGDDELAVQYLNTRLRGKRATDLAHQLFVVLDRRLPARLNALSDVPEGSLSNPLKPNQEIVGSITTDDGSVDIILERVDRGKAGLIWLFSSNTLELIPALFDDINEVSVENVLPEFLVNTRVAGIPLFEWLAVLVGIPLFFILASLINRGLSRMVGRWRRHRSKNSDLPNPQILPVPIRILLLAGSIRWLLTVLSLPLLARQFWSSTASTLTIGGCVWLLILLSSSGEGYIRRRLQVRNLTGATSMLRLARWAIDVLIIFAGVLVTLRYFGVDPTAALAGLGVGGIAVALAAQKTLENVIGGISLIFDRAVEVGDTLKVGEVSGTVDDIGLRSTRIRTLDRSVVSVPNGQIATMSLEDLSARDKFWFHPILSLRYGTTPGQMRVVLESIRRLLEETRLVEATSVRVRFLHFGPSSLDVEVFAYILANDWEHFLEVQEALLLRIMECVESAGVNIALPSQIIFMAPGSASTEAGGAGLLKASAPDKNFLDPAATKSA
jgi:MscS family membrane protein